METPGFDLPMFFFCEHKTQIWSTKQTDGDLLSKEAWL